VSSRAPFVAKRRHLAIVAGVRERSVAAHCGALETNTIKLSILMMFMACRFRV
jgi:hypothetical protein